MEAAKCRKKKTGLDGSVDKYLYTNEDRSFNSQHSHRNPAGMTLPVFQALRRERQGITVPCWNTELASFGFSRRPCLSP